MSDLLGHDSQASASALSEHIRRFGTDPKQKTGVHPDSRRREALIPPIPGATDPGVFNTWEVLCGNPLLGKRVEIVGGGSVGLETALFVAAKGTITPEILHFLFTYEAKALIGSES